MESDSNDEHDGDVRPLVAWLDMHVCLALVLVAPVAAEPVPQTGGLESMPQTTCAAAVSPDLNTGFTSNPSGRTWLPLPA